jgi:hypothetical protein
MKTIKIELQVNVLMTVNVDDDGAGPFIVDVRDIDHPDPSEIMDSMTNDDWITLARKYAEAPHD